MTTARLQSSTASSDWRDRIWAAVRKHKKFTLTEVVTKSGMTQRATRDYLTGLERAGFISKQTEVDSYLLVRDTGPEAPVLNHRGRHPDGYAIREALWRTMKLLKEFTVLDLAVNATTENCRVSESEARSYLRALVEAGYVIALARDVEGRAPAGRLLRYRFRASRNTGPRPPVLQQVLQVYDANEGKVVWQAGGGA